MTLQYDTLRKKLLSDPKVKKAYEALRPEFEIAKTLIKARTEAHLTQQEVAQRMKTSQSAVARMESGRYLPSLQTLYRYAHALKKPIQLTIFP